MDGAHGRGSENFECFHPRVGYSMEYPKK